MMILDSGLLFWATLYIHNDKLCFTITLLHKIQKRKNNRN